MYTQLLCLRVRRQHNLAVVPQTVRCPLGLTPILCDAVSVNLVQGFH